MNNDRTETSSTVTGSSPDAEPRKGDDNSQLDALDRLQDDIIRNDTIPETSRTTPGSNGAFPVGAFDNSKD